MMTKGNFLIKFLSLITILLSLSLCNPAYAEKYDSFETWAQEQFNGYQESSRPKSVSLGSRQTTRTSSYAPEYYTPQSIGPYNAGPKPSKWCGWWLRTQRGGGPEYNVAWNWRKYGRPSEPQVGAVVVWRHHVGQIVGRTSDGRWLVQSGNDSNAVRTRVRDISNALIRVSDAA